MFGQRCDIGPGKDNRFKRVTVQSSLSLVLRPSRTDDHGHPFDTDVITKEVRGGNGVHKFIL